MINAPIAVVNALNSGSFSSANLITVNLGDAYDIGSPVTLYLTDYAHPITYGGNTFTPDNHLVELAGISRKATVGSDVVDIVFSVTDPTLIDVIRSERYINQPTIIERVIIENGTVLGDYAIPIRTAWGITHSISGDVEDRTITLSIDSSLGDLAGDNGWYALNSSHERRYAGDKIMKHSGTVMTDEQRKKYTTNFKGVINEELKPPALAKIYGYKNVELIPICMLKHRKTHTLYRHYFTTMIYAVNIGDCDYVDINNLRMADETFDYKIVTNTERDVGGWSVRLRTPTDANTSSLLQEETNGDLSFWFEGMDTVEKNRMIGMTGKGLTLLFVKNRNRDDWLATPPVLTVPVRGARVYDPRTASTVYSRNPALQYADFLRSTEYGAGNRNISVSDADVIALANHFDSIPDSIGNAGINSILIDVQLDTAKPLVENMNIWMDGVRLYTSDYYGEFKLRVETKSTVSLTLTEDDLIEYPDYDSGAFTDRLNLLTYTIKQLVPDPDPEAIGKLVEVSVEATFPVENSQQHLDWLDEDGGIHSFDSKELSYVTELEQAFYWCMVDARISRQPRTMSITVGDIGWLTEVGDVIDFTSEIMDMTNTLWRVEEVEENDDGYVELALVAYDDNFYTPDPDAVPDPVAPAQPPTGVLLPAVEGLAIIENKGFYYLDWTPLSSANVTGYAVEITKDSVVVIDKPRVTQPPLLIETIDVGDHVVSVVTLGIQNESLPATLNFTIAIPEAPTINYTAGDFTIEIYPTLTKTFINTTFELMINTINDFNTATNKGTSGSFTVSDLAIDTVYYVWVRATNIVGSSDWSTATISTTDGTKFYDLINTSPSLTLTADSQFFAVDKDGNITPATITLTATRTNIIDPVGWSTFPVVTLGGAGDVRTLSATDMGANKQITVTATAEGITDTFTIVKLVDGSNAVVGYLTNEAHVLPSDSDGNIGSLASAGGTFKVYDGLVDVTDQCTFTIVFESGVDADIGLNDGVYVINTFTSDSGQVIFNATYGSVVIAKSYSIAKSRAGAGIEMYYINYPNGTAIKNGTGTLNLEAHIIAAGQDNLLTGTPVDPQLYDGATPLGYTASFNSAAINGSKVITLKNGAAILDSVTLVDVADGSEAIVGSVSSTGSLSWVQAPNNGAWSPTATTVDLAFVFYKSGASVGARTVRITRSGSNLTVSNVSSSGENVNYTASGSGTNSITITATHSNSGIQVLETVVAVQGGAQGAQGVAGTNGTNGTTFYTWIAYADNASGSGISNSPTGKAYIGISSNQTSPTEVYNPAFYTWSQMTGTAGTNGTNGANGVTYYTWIKYSDVANGNPMYDVPTSNTKYIGIVPNQTSPTESTNYALYTWSRFKGDTGDTGATGTQGVAGQNGDNSTVVTATSNGNKYPAQGSTTTLCTAYTFNTYGQIRIQASAVGVGEVAFGTASGTVTLRLKRNGVVLATQSVNFSTSAPKTVTLTYDNTGIAPPAGQAVLLEVQHTGSGSGETSVSGAGSLSIIEII